MKCSVCEKEAVAFIEHYSAKVKSRGVSVCKDHLKFYEDLGLTCWYIPNIEI